MKQPMELLLGSRGRPDRLEDMISTALAFAAGDLDLLTFRVRLDEDDDRLPGYRALEERLRGHYRLILVVGKRVPVPQLTAELAMACETDLMMLGCSDDIQWRTHGWDEEVRAVFDRCPDGLLVAATDDRDGRPQRKCQHFFTTKRWLAYVGGGWSQLEHFGVDHWHERVALKASRMVYLDVVAEHLHMKHRYPAGHPLAGQPKALPDETYRSKRRPAQDGRSPSDRDIARLTAGEALMDEQAARVRAAMRVAA